MSEFKIIHNDEGIITHIETPLMGHDLLSNAMLNKGCAFAAKERKEFHLDGLLPKQVETLEQQVARMYAQYNEHSTPLSKNIYLNALHDYNETLFYKLISQYLCEMLPIIYTPTVGEAVQNFSLEHRKARGLYISYPNRKHIGRTLEHFINHKIELAVVTDGEAVLGLGDQGIGGIIISIAKLMVYSSCGGINPYKTIPIQLDVGTNNPKLLSDPMYLGWRHERIIGQEYDDFIDMFVTTLLKKFPHTLLHWEDFGRDNARRILSRYKDDICTINGDIQTTGVVALGCILAAIKASNIDLCKHNFVIFGAGTAGTGIADQISKVLQREGMSHKESLSHILLIDKSGLLTTATKDILPFQKPYAVNKEFVSGWKLKNKNSISLLDVIKNAKTTTLIGCSAVHGAFDEKCMKAMAANNEKPIIMPLSNPNTLSEATPADILKWTKGKAIIATGSPFADVEYEDKTIRIAQSNNAFAFPGIGLGTIAVKAKNISEGMLFAATKALEQLSPSSRDPNAPLLPKLTEIQSISRHIALAVALQARNEGLAQLDDKVELNRAINQVGWSPKYYSYKKV